MTERIASLITEDGIWLPVKKRTAAVIREVYVLQDKIESCKKGSIEIIIDFKDGTVKPTVREVGEPRRIE